MLFWPRSLSPTWIYLYVTSDKSGSFVNLMNWRIHMSLILLDFTWELWIGVFTRSSIQLNSIKIFLRCFLKKKQFTYQKVAAVQVYNIKKQLTVFSLHCYLPLKSQYVQEFVLQNEKFKRNLITKKPLVSISSFYHYCSKFKLLRS